MKEGLLESIQGIGHWRVNLRPLQPLAEKLSFSRCLEEVDRARVEIRGWDYPHINRQSDESGGSSRLEDCYESWCSWHTQHEFWRMYRSGQFLSYKVLSSDLGLEGRTTPNLVLGVQDTIFTVTEFVEFTIRLIKNSVYKNGAFVNIQLNKTFNRRLQAGQGRMPFFEPKYTEAQNICLERNLMPDQVDTGATEVACSVLLELFDYFGWNPNPAQIRFEQEKFYRREWY